MHHQWGRSLAAWETWLVFGLLVLGACSNETAPSAASKGDRQDAAAKPVVSGGSGGTASRTEAGGAGAPAGGSALDASAGGQVSDGGTPSGGSANIDAGQSPGSSGADAGTTPISACGEAVDAGDHCLDNCVPETVVTANGVSSSALSPDKSHLVLGTLSDIVVVPQRAGLTGASAHSAPVYAVASDSRYAYFSPGAPKYGFFRVGLDDGSGATSTELYMAPSPYAGVVFSRAMAVDGKDLLVSAMNLGAGSAAAHGIYRLASSGGTPAPVPGLEQASSVLSMVVVGGHLFWYEGDSSQGKVFVADLSGSQPAEIDFAMGPTLATDGTYVYYLAEILPTQTTTASSILRRVLASNPVGSARQDVAKEGYSSDNFVVDDTYVYMAGGAKGLFRISTDGSFKGELIAGFHSQLGSLLGVDCSSVYAVGGGGVVRFRNAP